MKKIFWLGLIIVPALMFKALKDNDSDKDSDNEDLILNEGEYAVGVNIAPAEIDEFYYTFENINFNASYLRYRFYNRDGKHYFFYEKRERPDDYGPTDENDVTSKGDLQISDKKYAELISFLKKGIVTAREISDAVGDSGPWTYLYWQHDEDVYQQFTFVSYEAKEGFERFCADLMEGKQ